MTAITFSPAVVEILFNAVPGQFQGSRPEESLPLHRGDDMASAKRIIRKALVEVLQSERASFDERIKAARMLTNLLGLAAKPGNPRNQGAKKNVKGALDLDRILSGIAE